MEQLRTPPMLRSLTLLVIAGRCLGASECAPSNLSPDQTLAKFQEIDRDAQSAFDNGRFAEAARGYREATCLVPKSARAFFGLGSSEAAAGNYAAAREAFETAYRLLPASPMPLAMLVRVNVAMRDTPKVKEVLRTAAEKFPSDADLHSGLARFLAENEMLDLALAESLRFEQTGSSNTESQVALAVLENTVGAYDDAIRHATAVENAAGVADQVRASAAGVAGLSYEGLGRRDEAIRHLQLAIDLAPKQENSYLALAFLYEKAENFKDAAAVLQQGHKRLPNSNALLLPLGNNLVWAAQYDAGIQILKQLNTPEAYVRLAEAYRKTGHPEQEVQALRDLARVKPDYPMFHVLMAQAMMNLDSPDYEQVLRELDAAANDADVFYLRGKTFVELKRYPDAIAAFQRSIEIRPMDPSAYYQLGLTYRKTGNAALARQMFDRFEHLKPR